MVDRGDDPGGADELAGGKAVDGVDADGLHALLDPGAEGLGVVGKGDVEGLTSSQSRNIVLGRGIGAALADVRRREVQRALVVLGCAVEVPGLVTDFIGPHLEGIFCCALIGHVIAGAAAAELEGCQRKGLSGVL